MSMPRSRMTRTAFGCSGLGRLPALAAARQLTELANALIAARQLTQQSPSQRMARQLEKARRWTVAKGCCGGHRSDNTSKRFDASARPGDEPRAASPSKGAMEKFRVRVGGITDASEGSRAGVFIQMT